MIKINWKEVQRECLEQRLKNEEVLKTILIVDLEVQNVLIEGIKAELEKLEKE